MIGDKLDHTGQADDLTVLLSFTYDFDPKTTAKIGLKFADGMLPLTVLGTEVLEGDPYSNPPGAFDEGYGQDNFWLDEAWVSHTYGEDDFWRFGRQFQHHGLGLVVNNERRAQNGFRRRFDGIFGLSNIDLDLFYGGSSYDWSPIPTGSVNSDGYFSGRLEYDGGRVDLGLTWLPDGVGQEDARGVDLSYRWSGDKYLVAEYAWLFHHANRYRWVRKNRPEAYAAALDLYKTDRLWLQGWYSLVDAEYDIQYSSLHPYVKIEQRNKPLNVLYWDRWLKRRPVLTNLEFIGGNVWTHLGEFPLHFSYYHVDEEAPNWFYNCQVSSVVFDELWALRTYRQLSENASVQLTYAQAKRGTDPNVQVLPPPASPPTTTDLGSIGTQKFLQLEFLLGF